MSIVYELYKPPGGKRYLNPHSEDILTANVFGLLKLLPPRLWLLRILQRVYGERSFVKLPYSRFSIVFWEKLFPPPHRKGVSEIDILVRVPPIVVLIECKYLSPIGKGQIIRYLDLAAFHYHSHNCENVYLLLISDDHKEPAFLRKYRNPKEIEDRVTRIRPHLDYKKISAALANNIGWISWKAILQVLEELLSLRLTYSEKKITEDLVCYMRYKLDS